MGDGHRADPSNERPTQPKDEVHEACIDSVAFARLVRENLEQARPDLLREGSYYPDWLLERRWRAEQALVSVVATSYVLGVYDHRDPTIRFPPPPAPQREYWHRTGRRAVAAALRGRARGRRALS
jgi:hypothetical protein